MMMPWLILGVVNSFFFFRVDTECVIINGDNEHNSASESRKVNEGVMVLIGNFFGVHILVVSLHPLKV